MIVRPFYQLPAPPKRFSLQDQVSVALSLLILGSIWARAISIEPSELASQQTTDHDHDHDHKHNHHHNDEEDSNSSSKFLLHDDGQYTSQGYDASGSLDHDYTFAEREPSSDDNQTDPVLSSVDNDKATTDDISSSPSDSLTNGDIHSADVEHLSLDLANKACSLDRGCQRKDRLSNTYLSLCTRYKLENILSNDMLDSIMHDSPRDCRRVLDEFLQLDELIGDFYRSFKSLLTRYNCHNGYSVKWTCEDCKKAYKDWLCATSLPFYMNGERIKPCISFCERVEQRCPYLHPITKEQYGGQPVFICRDPNIPFVPEITPDIPYSEPRKCYDLCHLTRNRTELIIDSLSKYEPDKCPDKNILAEQVRNDYCQLQLPVSNNITSSDVGQQQQQQQPQQGKGTDINGTTGDSSHGANQKSNAKVDDVHLMKLKELEEVRKVYESQNDTQYLGHH